VSIIPLGIVLFSIAVPIALARSPRPKRALRWLYALLAVSALLWAWLCLSVYPAYVFPE
jgi:hypothetical protein